MCSLQTALTFIVTVLQMGELSSCCVMADMYSGYCGMNIIFSLQCNIFTVWLMTPIGFSQLLPSPVLFCSFCTRIFFAGFCNKKLCKSISVFCHVLSTQKTELNSFCFLMQKPMKKSSAVIYKSPQQKMPSEIKFKIKCTNR